MTRVGGKKRITKEGKITATIMDSAKGANIAKGTQKRKEILGPREDPGCSAGKEEDTLALSSKEGVTTHILSKSTVASPSA